MLAVLLSIAGCSGLPVDVNRPASYALNAGISTSLGRVVKANRDAAGVARSAGFLLLSGPQAAYSSRLALVDAAEKTLDLQYYAIHADTSSERLLRAVAAAARRGVRVRVLLDDLHTSGPDAQVMRLAFVPNIEMRMFNPLTGARGSAIGRMLGSVADFSRVQQRMHNKLFVADNAMAITGGRNLGDAYFGNSDAGNFVDLDVLAAGPVVQDLSRSFDSYWNNERAYPVQSLISRAELDGLRKGNLADADATKAQPVRPSTGDSTLGNSASPTDAQRAAAAATDAQRARIWNYQPMDLGRTAFVWAPAAVLVDKPAKIQADAVSTDALPELSPSRATPLAITAPSASAFVANTKSAVTAKNSRTPSSAATNTTAIQLGDTATASEPIEPLPEAQTDTVVDGLLELIGQARRDLLIVSPYFVPGPDMVQAFAGARARGVRIRVLTNSLASNDAPIAHAGYARHRPELLALGVELYEMRAELPGKLRGAWGGLGSTGKTGSGDRPAIDAPGSSRAMLHSKVLIMDGYLLVIGSMNLDMRSQLQNTEIALLIKSTTLSRQATAQLEVALADGAWQVQQTDAGLLWRAPKGSGLDDATTEPDASAPLRWLLKLLGPFAPDQLL